MTFGTPVMSAQALVSAFHAAYSIPLPQSGSELEKSGRKASTNEINRVFRALGLGLGLKVRHKLPPRLKDETREIKRSMREHPEREFLYDVDWMDDDGRLALAGESELSTFQHTVMHDFSKLLHAKCPIKFLIYTDFKKDVRPAAKTELIKYGRNAPGEEYILINLCNWRTRFLESTVFSFYERNGVVALREVSLPHLKWGS
ncbi:MAG TPA: hypothetical protein VNU44_03580 [Bryobacteraceae bacterium]|jgi:hypothetical protein|nr:hypothetical protein [Bryobacteraceae bacterium]